MLSRRVLLQRGFAALAVGMSAQVARAARLAAPGDPDARTPRPCPKTGAADLASSNPFRAIGPGPVVNVAGFPFAANWLGEGWDNNRMPFHGTELPGAPLPEPTERNDIVVVGGGLAGLTSMYLLRRHKPILLELHDRFGGYSQGETWDGLECSIGGAYFMVADPGTFLHRLYHQLGLRPIEHTTFANADDPFEVQGQYVPAADFWAGAGLSAEEREAFTQYALLVTHYAENYPDIPLDPNADNAWIRALDRVTLEAHIRQSLTVPIPRRLIAAIQGYTYSSFGAGWEELSAAAGFNFIAAEEFGRWVLPGGNAGLAHALWAKLREMEPDRPGCQPIYLRAGCPAVAVDVAGPEDVRVTYRDIEGQYRTISTRRVVMACPKHVCRRVIRQWADFAPEQTEATSLIRTRPYLVANVLLRKPMSRAFYDLFLLGDGSIADMFAQDVPMTDAVDGLFAHQGRRHRTILTIYWPRPFEAGRAALIDDHGWQNHADAVAARLPAVLDLVGLRPRDVHQVRMARWGHSLPVAVPNLLADGVFERVRQPFREHVFFVNQDNWALPAVETSLLEAEAMRPLIEAGL